MGKPSCHQKFFLLILGGGGHLHPVHPPSCLRHCRHSAQAVKPHVRVRNPYSSRALLESTLITKMNLC